MSRPSTPRSTRSSPSWPEAGAASVGVGALHRLAVDAHLARARTAHAVEHERYDCERGDAHRDADEGEEAEHLAGRVDQACVLALGGRAVEGEGQHEGGEQSEG